MKSVFYLTIYVMTIAATAQAQMTIGSINPPDSNALLDLKETGTTTKGLLLPRVSLKAQDLPDPMSAHVAGMVVYNTDTSLTTVLPENRVSPGFYYNTGSRWEKFSYRSTNWFYMPSIAIDVSVSGTFTRDLYLEYRKQFEDTLDSTIDPVTSPAAGTALVSSPDAPNPFTAIYNADELYYYVTGYDEAVFSNLTLTVDGKLNYTVDADSVTDATYMNIVFVERK